MLLNLHYERLPVQILRISDLEHLTMFSMINIALNPVSALEHLSLQIIIDYVEALALRLLNTRQLRIRIAQLSFLRLFHHYLLYSITS